MYRVVTGSFAATAALDDAGGSRARWPRHGDRGDGKKERAPTRFTSWGVSRKRHVLTCRGGESERLDGVPAGHRRARSRVKTKRPPAVLAGGLENPAATYSPGSEDQVPSAMWGLTSVFGMGTGMTPTRLPLKQTLAWKSEL